MTHLNRRHFKDRIFAKLCSSVAFTVAGGSALFVLNLIWQGLSGLSWNFFLNVDSRSPLIAGVKGSLVGSIWVLLIVILTAFPIGILTALYLEELSPPKLLKNILEKLIANLTSIPSVLFGLLGVAIFLNTWQLPRSSSLVGGLTLSLFSLPPIIMTTQSTLRSIPRSIRDAALGLGASPLQVTFHHILPLAVPSLITSGLIVLGRVLGETAPLLLLGMSAFILEVPSSPLDPSTTLSLQIYNWSSFPEPGFVAKAAAGIVVLLILIALLNLMAFFLRIKFQPKWM